MTSETPPVPFDEDNSVHEATEGDPSREAKPTPGLYTDDQEKKDPEDADES